MRFSQELVALIKEKKELSELSDDFVVDAIEHAFHEMKSVPFEKYASFKQFRRSSYCKDLISLVRKRLRIQYGVFKRDTVALHSSLSSLDSVDDPAILHILETHQSTFERLPYYDDVYAKIFSLLKEQGLSDTYVLADLACGLNPLTYSKLPLKPSFLYAVDLSPNEMNALQSFFDRTGISGNALAFDLLSPSFEEWFSSKKFDVCFLFKALDSLEFVKKHASKKFMAKLSSQFFVVSFALTSIGGKNDIVSTKRGWFDRFCERNGWSYQIVNSPNEVYYVIKTF